MQPALSHGLALLVGVGGGAALTWLAASPATEAPAPAPVAAPAPIAHAPVAAPDAPAAAPSPAPSIPPATLEACTTALAERDTQLAVLQGQLALYGGARTEWPDDVDPRLERPAMEALVQQALPDLDDAELVELDCDEYPCVAVLTFPDGGADSDRLLPLVQVFQDEFGRWPVNLSVHSVSGDGMIAGVALTGEQPAHDAAKRLDIRMKDRLDAHK